jgi:hypothetical protein
VFFILFVSIFFLYSTSFLFQCFFLSFLFGFFFFFIYSSLLFFSIRCSQDSETMLGGCYSFFSFLCFVITFSLFFFPFSLFSFLIFCFSFFFPIFLIYFFYNKEWHTNYYGRWIYWLVARRRW